MRQVFPQRLIVTDTRPISRKYAVNIFPNDNKTWSGQDSNPGPSAHDISPLTTWPQRPMDDSLKKIEASTFVKMIGN